MMEQRRPPPTEEVRDAVVRDYLRGDKGILIQMEHKISPGVMYRILNKRGVLLRTVSDQVPEDEPAPATEAARPGPPPPEPAARPGPPAPEPVAAPVAEEPQESGFLRTIRQIQTQEMPTEDVLDKVYDALAEWFPKEHELILKEIGLWGKATGEGVTPDDIVRAAMETLVVLCLRAIPEAEEIAPGVFRLQGEGAPLAEEQPQIFKHSEALCGEESFSSHLVLHQRCTCGKFAHQTHSTKHRRKWYCRCCGKRFDTSRLPGRRPKPE